MARPKRGYLPGQPVHLIQRGNNRQKVFFEPEDYARYLAWLSEASAANGCTIYAYVLMPNHVHLLAEPAHADSIPRTLQSLGRRYVRYINATHGRTGTLWEGRARAATIDTEAYFLACARYIELNPVRAGIVKQPRDYRWSSYEANAHGGDDPLVAEHTLMTALGPNDTRRRANYRALFRQVLDPAVLDAIRGATNAGWALGEEPFQRGVGAALGHRVASLPRGRPFKAK